MLVADGIVIPGNVGTLMRTLDACNADCLVLTNRRTRLSHPTNRVSQRRGMRLVSRKFRFSWPANWLINVRTVM